MRKALFGLALLIAIMSMTLGGCASLCGHEAEQRQVMESSPPPVAEVRPAPAPPPAAVPVPPPKKDRN